MQINETFFKNVGIDPAIAPDIEFSVIDTKSPDMIVSYQKDELRHNKSVGSIQTMLGMHQLMAKSLALVSPNLVFSADFPDYLLHQDNPEYMQTIPMITPELYKQMPHFRNDLFERDFSEYDRLEKVPAPHITWGVVRTEPGTMSGTPFRGTQELKPRQREVALVFNKEYSSVIKSNSDGDFVEKDGKLYKFIRVYGQVFDNLVQYNTWTRSSWEAEELIDWFQREYMLPYTGMFRQAGINEMVFQRRVRDDTLMRMNNKYNLRSMLYYIRTEHITSDTIMPITKIDVSMNTLASTADFVIGNNVVNYYDQLVNNWHSKNNL